MTGFLALIPIFAAGFFINAIFLRERTALPLLREMPTIFGLGAGTLYLFFMYGSWFGPVSLLTLYFFIAALGCGWFFCRPAASCGLAEAGEESAGRWENLFLLGLLATLILNVFFSLSLPLPADDTRILWALKAKFLTADPTLSGEVFRDPYRLHIHPRYPLLVPFLASWMARHHGAFLEGHYQLLITLFGLLTVAQLYLLLQRLAGRRNALFLTLLMALSGVWMNAQFAASIEIALTFFLLLSLNYLFLWIEKRQTITLFLAGFFLFATAMSKNEGFLLVLCVVFSCFLVLLRKGEVRLALRVTAILLSVFLCLSAVWFAHLGFIPSVSDENYLARLMTADLFISGFGRLPLLAETVMARMTDLRQWHLLWLTPLLVVIAVMRNKVPINQRLMLLILVASTYFLGIMMVYILSPWRDISMHINLTYDRVLLPLVPIFILLLAFVSDTATRERAEVDV